MALGYFYGTVAVISHLFFLLPSLFPLANKLVTLDNNEVVPSGEGRRCEDDLPDCWRREQLGQCFGFDSVFNNDGKMTLNSETMMYMMSFCRKTCREAYRKKRSVLDDSIHKLVSFMGGFDDILVDIFGYEHKICDLNDAMVAKRRLDYIATTYMTQMVKHKVIHLPIEHTKRGILTTKVPKKLWGDILDEYEHRKNKPGQWGIPPCDEAHINCKTIMVDNEECSYSTDSSINQLDLTTEMKDNIHKQLKPFAEKWAGVELIPTIVFGIRRYSRGSWLAAHVDKNLTHVISAIINVDQKVDEDWPLDIYDHQGNAHLINMKPGDLVWYESAILPHGRVQKLKGDFYDNIFVHYRPKNETDRLLEKQKKAGDSGGSFNVPISFL